MSYEQYIELLNKEAVLAECGPMHLVIRAWRNGRPQTGLAVGAAGKAFTYLERIAGLRSELSRPLTIIEIPPGIDPLAGKMAGSVCAVGDDDLTPMAAVAGTIADAVADWLFERGATRVIVDNGGDIAIRLSGDETAAVGIRPRVGSREISHVLQLNSSRGSWGVTTSGCGGRSFTRGIASAVTTLAASASVADAAATAIANACYVEDPGIIQVPADQVDPETDIPGVRVTLTVGLLSREKKRLAVNRALAKADQLLRKDIIAGALVVLEDIFVATGAMNEIGLAAAA